MIEYKLLEAIGSAKFNQELNKHAEQGWVPWSTAISAVMARASQGSEIIYSMLISRTKP